MENVNEKFCIGKVTHIFASEMYIANYMDCIVNSGSIALNILMNVWFLHYSILHQA